MATLTQAIGKNNETARDERHSDGLVWPTTDSFSSFPSARECEG